MGTVLEITRQAQFKQIHDHCKAIGHELKPIPPLRNNRSKGTCLHCGLTCDIRARRIPLPDGKVNNQMKAEGPVMVKVCTKVIN